MMDMFFGATYSLINQTSVDFLFGVTYNHNN